MEKYFRKKMDVSVFSEERPNMRVMRGKALLDDAAADFKFVENAPRGARSVEVGRTLHSRFVRRPDGNYTITLRCSGDSKYLREELTAEVAEIARLITADRRQQKKTKRDDNKEETITDTQDCATQ